MADPRRTAVHGGRCDPAPPREDGALLPAFTLTALVLFLFRRISLGGSSATVEVSRSAVMTPPPHCRADQHDDDHGFPQPALPRHLPTYCPAPCSSPALRPHPGGPREQRPNDEEPGEDPAHDDDLDRHRPCLAFSPTDRRWAASALSRS